MSFDSIERGVHNRHSWFSVEWIIMSVIRFKQCSIAICCESLGQLDAHQMHCEWMHSFELDGKLSTFISIESHTPHSKRLFKHMVKLIG